MKNCKFCTSRVAIVSGLSLALVALSGCAKTPSQPTSVAAGASCGELGNDGELLAHFYDPGTLKKATPVQERVFRARAIQPVRTMGASLYLPAEADINGPYLHRVLACHAAAGQNVHPNDPLHPQSGPIAQLIVRENANGYTVDVLADDPQVGSEIWQRAQSLSGMTTDVQVEVVGTGDASTGHL